MWSPAALAALCGEGAPVGSESGAGSEPALLGWKRSGRARGHGAGQQNLEGWRELRAQHPRVRFLSVCLSVHLCGRHSACPPGKDAPDMRTAVGWKHSEL